MYHHHPPPPHHRHFIIIMCLLSGDLIGITRGARVEDGTARARHGRITHTTHVATARESRASVTCGCKTADVSAGYGENEEHPSCPCRNGIKRNTLEHY